MDKHRFTYQDIHRTARDISERVTASGYQVDVIVAIGTGGFIPARIIRTYLGKPILAVGIAYYDANDKPIDNPRKVQWIEEAERKLAGKRILLVDEVDDSRSTLEYCIRELMRHHPAEIAVAVLHDKRKEKRGAIPTEVKQYFAGQTVPDIWIVYPWDAEDIDAHDALAAAQPPLAAPQPTLP
jgi:hypoxanthine phosphoribosyltransferase